ncbi:GNAT family N-acetyltransferase [Pontibacterium granulatum]|uniref:GNAT family N-acetyltransferase n=1 Tax=Pontibacterium granulatum TaxID=2036029 RepID=UPI00249BBBBB|nr:GNAT family N-acetyltransferase [Pontibacterium granulatum]MDI3325577.1 GNAT family N-acetyltransferase [Pontibacterium granulatum]
MLKILSVSGEALKDYIPALAALRIRVFREFPYLYDGDLAYEEEYLSTYVQAPDSVIVLVFDGDEVVGASTAIPMANETVEFKQPFIGAGYNPDEIFYCGESVLLPKYRGQGVGVVFFEQREAHAAKLGGFKFSCFCAVDRPADHPRRPADYEPLDSFWQKRGYQKTPELATSYSWKDLDETEQSAKPMTFWMKAL